MTEIVNQLYVDNYDDGCLFVAVVNKTNGGRYIFDMSGSEFDRFVEQMLEHQRESREMRKHHNDSRHIKDWKRDVYNQIVDGNPKNVINP